MNPFANIGNIFLFRCVGACFLNKEQSPKHGFTKLRAGFLCSFEFYRTAITEKHFRRVPKPSVMGFGIRLFCCSDQASALQATKASVAQFFLQYLFQFVGFGINGEDGAVGCKEIAAATGKRHAILLPHTVLIIEFQ